MRDYRPTAMYPLAKGKVRYVGEPIVAVVAESRYIAEDALERIYVELDALPDVTDPERAAEPGAPLLHDEAGSNVLVRREFKREDVDAALAGAAVRVGGRFRFRRKTPMAIENRAYLAEYDAAHDGDHAVFLDPGAGRHPRLAGGVDGAAGQPPARGRAGCRRRVRRQGLALRRRN